MSSATTRSARPARDDVIWRPGRGRRRGVQHACAKLYDVVIIDTAGRLAVDADLMQQASDIRDATDPDEVPSSSTR